VTYRKLHKVCNFKLPVDFKHSRGIFQAHPKEKNDKYNIFICLFIHWKKRGLPRRTWKDGICTAMNKRDPRMGEWNNRRQWNTKVGRRRQTFQILAIYIYIYIYIYISIYMAVPFSWPLVRKPNIQLLNIASNLNFSKVYVLYEITLLYI
jgi:hypothetical protein